MAPREPQARSDAGARVAQGQPRLQHAVCSGLSGREGAGVSIEALLIGTFVIAAIATCISVGLFILMARDETDDES